MPVLGLAIAAALTVLALGLFAPAGSIVLFTVLAAQAGVSALGRRRDCSTSGLAARPGRRGANRHACHRVCRAAARARRRPAGVGLGERRAPFIGAGDPPPGRGPSCGVALGHLVTGVGTIAAALVAQWAMSVGLNDAVAAVVVLAPLAVGDAFVGLPDAMGAWARARGSEARLWSLLDQPPAVADLSPGRGMESEGNSGSELELVGVAAQWRAGTAVTGRWEVSERHTT